MREIHGCKVVTFVVIIMRSPRQSCYSCKKTFLVARCVMMCTSCHCCRCLPPAQTFRIILQILYHKVLLPHWSRVSIGSLVYTWWSYIQVYTHVFQNCANLFRTSRDFWKSAEKLSSSLESCLESPSLSTFPSTIKTFGFSLKCKYDHPQCDFDPSH